MAEVDGTVVGHAVTSLAGDIAELQRIAVTPAARRTGVATDLLDAEAGTIALLTATGDAVELATVKGPAAERLHKQRLGLGQGLIGWSIAQRRAVMVNDAERDTRYAAEFAREHGVTSRSLLVAPVISSDTVVGAIEVLDKRSGAPTLASLREAGADPARLLDTLRTGEMPGGYSLAAT